MFSGEFAGPGSRYRRAVVAAVAAAVCLGGCSAGDVQFEGKLFELAGFNSIGKRGEAPEISERTGLVVPPDLNKLPDPNQAAAPNPADAALASINDPDRANEVSQEELQRQQDVACKEYELAKMRGEADSVLISGPLGPCRKSLLTNVGGFLNSK